MKFESVKNSDIYYVFILRALMFLWIFN